MSVVSEQMDDRGGGQESLVTVGVCSAVERLINGMGWDGKGGEGWLLKGSEK